jgi:hypothetical protein
MLHHMCQVLGEHDVAPLQQHKATRHMCASLGPTEEVRCLAGWLLAGWLAAGGAHLQLHLSILVVQSMVQSPHRSDSVGPCMMCSGTPTGQGHCLRQGGRTCAEVGAGEASRTSGSALVCVRGLGNHVVSVKGLKNAATVATMLVCQAAVEA